MNSFKIRNIGMLVWALTSSLLCVLLMTALLLYTNCVFLTALNFVCAVGSFLAVFLRFSLIQL